MSGFLHDYEVAALANNPATRLVPLIVRCGGGRFIVPAQDAQHFIAIIEREGTDYIRDVSIKPEDHRCIDHAVRYEDPKGAIGHGYECGICGAFLQAG